VKRFALFGMPGLLLATGLVLLLATGSAGAGPPVPTDGTLIVRDGIGHIVINAKGGVIGRFDKGQVTIKDPIPGDGTGPIVTGAEAEHSINDTTTRYSGANVRFRIIGGKFAITVDATNVDLSAIGNGSVKINGKGTSDDGDYSMNGGPAQPFPSFVFTFALAPPPQIGG
jgi:hypothetical protein